LKICRTKRLRVCWLRKTRGRSGPDASVANLECLP
jgi:hypothetical protein